MDDEEVGEGVLEEISVLKLAGIGTTRAASVASTFGTWTTDLRGSFC